MKQQKHAYHHGNLRRALLDEALRVIAAEGPAGVSLRDLARRLGVSHAAPSHHFHDKLDLLTAIAAEGYQLLGLRMEGLGGGSLLDIGLTYVRFAVDHPSHISVMYQPSLYRTDDPGVEEGRRRSSECLFSAARRSFPEADQTQVGLAGWCLMHGVATLWLGGTLRQYSDDPVALARWVAEVAFGGAAVFEPPAATEFENGSR